MGQKTRNVMELESLLADFVAPHLRTAGFRKSAHTFRRREANGDEAALQFHGWPLGRMCSFLFDVWITIEPAWDLSHFNPDRPRKYPTRAHTFEATFHRQPRMPELDDPWPPLGEPWGFDDSASRDQVGHQLQDFLLEHVLPDVRNALDRTALRDAAQQEIPILGLRHGLEQVRLALLVDAGPSEELDSVLLALDVRDPHDAKFAQWSAARLLDGPTWRELTPGIDAQDLD